MKISGLLRNCLHLQAGVWKSSRFLGLGSSAWSPEMEDQTGRAQAGCVPPACIGCATSKSRKSLESLGHEAGYMCVGVFPCLHIRLSRPRENSSMWWRVAVRKGMRDRTQEASRQCGKGTDTDSFPGGHCQGLPGIQPQWLFGKRRLFFYFILFLSLFVLKLETMIIRKHLAL